MSKPKSRPFINCSTYLPLVTKPNHQFLADLLRHSRPNRNTPSFVPPSLCGRIIDLRALYNEVVIRGGHKQVTSMHQWNEVYMALGFPPGCVDAGHRLRTIYQRSLESFERSQRMVAKSAFAADDFDTSFGAETDSQDVDSAKYTKSQLPAAQTMSLKSDDIPNHLRGSWNLSTDLADRVDYSSLELSLLSNLPNELDFALNTMLLMSSQPNGFSLYKNERLLDLLLSCVGIFVPERLMCNSHKHTADMHLRFLKFWNSNVLEPVGRIFLSPGVLDSVQCSSPSKKAIDHYLSQVHDMSYGDDEGFRVQLVATVLRNLAVEGGASAVVIGRHSQALRFLFLCIYANHSSLHQLGLEALSSLHFPVVGQLVPALHRLIPDLLTSPDRNDQMRGLQLIGRLCEAPICLTRHGRCTPNGTYLTLRDRSVLSNDRNTGFLCSLPPVVFRHVVQNLCLRDLHLVVLAIDAVYSLSCLGQFLCERLLHPFPHRSDASADLSTVHLLPTLVALLRLEAQAMGSDSVIRLRVMQALPNTGTSAITPKSTVTPGHAKPQVSTLPPTVLSKADCPPRSTTTCTGPQSSVLSRYVIPLPVALTTTTPVNMAKSTASSAPNPQVHSIQIRPFPVKETSKVDCSLQLPVLNSPCRTQSYIMPSSQPTPCSTSTVSTPPIVTTSPIAPVRLPPLAIRIQPVKRVEPTSEPNPCEPATSTSESVTPVVSRTPPVILAANHNVPELRPSALSGSTSISTTGETNEPVESSRVSEITNNQKRLEHIGRLSTTDLVKIASKPPFKSHPVLPYRPAVRKATRCLKDNSAVSHSPAARLEYMFEWLRKNYVVHSHSSVSRVQIYMDYQRAHQRRFGDSSTAVSPVEFHSEIKSIFPGVGQVKVQVPGDKVIIHYNNLRCLHSPESNTEQGVNDIMAAVLSPNKEETLSTIKRTSKQKNRKRPNAKPLTGLTQVKRTAPYPQPNGHTETKDLVNGTLTTTSNGLTKDIVNLIAHSVPSGSLPLRNGSPIQSHHNLMKLPVSTMSNCPKLNELVSHDHGLVIFPMFAPLNLNQTSQNHSDQQSITENGLRDTKLDAPITLSQPLHITGNALVKSKSVEIENADSNTDMLTLPPSIPNGVPVKNPFTVLVDSKQHSAELSGSSEHLNATPNPPVCLWNACSKVLKDRNSLFTHLSVDHVPSVASVQTINCLWLGCNQTSKLANAEQLLSHLCEQHLQGPPQASFDTPKKSLNNDSSVAVSTVSSDSRETCSPGLHVISHPTVTDPSAAIPRCTVSDPTDLFRHPSKLVDQQKRLMDSVSRTLHVIQDAAPHDSTASQKQQCSSTLFAQSSPSVIEPVPHSTPVTSLAEPTVWCPSPPLSDECRRALAGGAPNPSFEIPPSREGPVTKHIRLTAALALKNFLRYSQTARRFISSWENLLCELAFSGLESSPTIFECLSYLHNGDEAYSTRCDTLPPLSASLLYNR